jgi:hypothetical protein
MTAMAHYGMYVNDTDGIDNIELEAESDVSYTSQGGQSLLDNFIGSHGGSYYAPLKRWILSGKAIPTNRLRVVSPCFAQGTCAGSGSNARRHTNAKARLASVPSHTTRRVAVHHPAAAQLTFTRHSSI